MAVCADWNVVHRAVVGPVPKVGVAVLVCRNERVLVCRRKSKTSYNHLALPGGFLEFGETLEECACREVQEETGMEIMNIKFGAVTNTVMLDNLQPVHYVTVFLKAGLTDPEQEPQTLEPDKCDGFTWIDWPNLPPPVFKPLQELLDMNYDPFL